MSELSTPSLEHVEQLSSVSKAKGFLGREFLTWLWYVAETSRTLHSVRNQTEGQVLEFDLWIDDRLVLEAHRGTSHQSSMKGGDPSQSLEAGAALGSGKTVRELKLGIHLKDHGDFTATLQWDDLTPRSLCLPTPDSYGKDGDEQTPVLLRLKQTELFLTVLDGLFAKFIDERTEDSWETAVLKPMRSWIASRGRQESQPSP